MQIRVSIWAQIDGTLLILDGRRKITYVSSTFKAIRKRVSEIAELDWFTSVDAKRCAPAIRLLIAELRTADLID